MLSSLERKLWIPVDSQDNCFLLFFIYNKFESGLTRGSHPNLTFMHDELALRDAHFKVIGQFVALALLNDANGPHLFCPLHAR